LTLNTKESIEKDQVTQKENQKIKNKVYRDLKQSENSYNVDATRIFNDIEQGRDVILDHANIALFIAATQFEPTSLNKLGITMMRMIKKHGGW
jgi:pyruvate kinase